MKRTKLWLILASLLSLALIAAACGSDDDDSSDDPAPTTAAPAEPTTTMMDDTDLSGTSVNVFGPESGQEADAINAALDIFSDQTGIDVTYTGARDFSDQINAQVLAGNPPDIAVLPQPGKLADFAREGEVLPLPANVAAATQANWPQSWNEFGQVDGRQYGIPFKSDLKSLVWYQPARFEANGYVVPETWADFKALVNQMIQDGNTPLCVGIESGPATGWAFTDWIEDLMLRFHGADFYDQCKP